MRAKSQARFCGLCSLLCLAGVGVMLTSHAAAERGVARSEGIGNFGKVDDRLYRGAQPDAAGIRNLARLGIKSIINLRQVRDVRQAEAYEARANGLIYTNVPLRGLHAPNDAQVSSVLALIESLPAPVFIHCEHGCDRTGTLVACYRLRRHGWSLESAQDEADRYGMSKLERGMRKYIARFKAAAQ